MKLKIKKSFFKKFAFSLLLIAAVLLFLSNCGIAKVINRSGEANGKTEDSSFENTVEYSVSVTDISSDFIGSDVLPENEKTEYEYIPTLKETDPKRIFYGAGTCSYLTGKKTVALFFVDDGKSSWDKASVIDFTQNDVLPALDFLLREADAHEIELSFEVWRFSNVLSNGLNMKYSGTVNPDLNKGGSTKDLFSQAAKSFGYSSDMAFRWALTEKSGGAEIIPIFLINKSGVSYARNVYIVGKVTQAEHAVVFSKSQEGPRNQAPTFAHELLHLYGAEELYIPVKRYNLAKNLYQNDIMCLETRNLEKLKIEGFTAYALGWTETVPEVCNDQDWYTDNYYQNYREWINR